MIAIYDRPGSFSDRWISVCNESGIAYTLVDLFDDNLVKRLHGSGVSVLLSHPPMSFRAATLAARGVIHALVTAGIRVFPTIADYWHFDDKISQKYLFEALDIPTPHTTVLFDRQSSLDWLSQATLPLVFKLRSGAGSTNVALIHDRRQGARRVRRMFGRGYPSTDSALKDYRTKIRLHTARRDWAAVLKRAPVTIANWWRLRRDLDRERGYVYFQEFVAENSYDTRVTVIGKRAFAFRRMVRPGDFRASGSGLIDHDPSSIDPRCIALAFDVSRRLGSSCLAFDFVKRNSDSTPLLLEMSFAFVSELVSQCPGYWQSDLSWNSHMIRPEDAILEDMLQSSSHDAL